MVSHREKGGERCVREKYFGERRENILEKNILQTSTLSIWERGSISKLLPFLYRKGRVSQNFDHVIILTFEICLNLINTFIVNQRESI